MTDFFSFERLAADQADASVVVCEMYFSRLDLATNFWQAYSQERRQSFGCQRRGLLAARPAIYLAAAAVYPNCPYLVFFHPYFGSRFYFHHVCVHEKCLRAFSVLCARIRVVTKPFREREHFCLTAD